jgi:hypothetical protein
MTRIQKHKSIDTDLVGLHTFQFCLRPLWNAQVSCLYGMLAQHPRIQQHLFRS